MELLSRRSAWPRLCSGPTRHSPGREQRREPRLPQGLLRPIRCSAPESRNRSGITAEAALATALQDHVKREIAPYKYPRAIEFVAQLPKTETGKLKRFALRQMAQAGAASAGMAAE